MTKLVNLDLDGNPCCQTEEYKREAIFAMIPSLEVSAPSPPYSITFSNLLFVFYCRFLT